MPKRWRDLAQKFRAPARSSATGSLGNVNEFNIKKTSSFVRSEQKAGPGQKPVCVNCGQFLRIRVYIRLLVPALLFVPTDPRSYRPRKSRARLNREIRLTRAGPRIDQGSEWAGTYLPRPRVDGAARAPPVVEANDGRLSGRLLMSGDKNSNWLKKAQFTACPRFGWRINMIHIGNPMTPGTGRGSDRTKEALSRAHAPTQKKPKTCPKKDAIPWIRGAGLYTGTAVQQGRYEQAPGRQLCAPW